MKQVLQSLGSGLTTVQELPTPRLKPKGILVQSTASLISAGTERMLVDFGRANWFAKVRQQPEKFRDVLDKIRTDGLATTIDAVRSKLDEPIALGYCNVGRVVATGPGVQGYEIGDRLVSNGGHAEIVSVTQKLTARIPDQVSDEDASFTVVGAIALQGIRLAQPTLGESFVVMGLGLIGLIAVQLLRAAGCRVLGIDPDPAKTALARTFGAEALTLHADTDPVGPAIEFSRGHGVDGVLLTLASQSDGPISQAAKMSRKRGRLVLIGVTGLTLNRADFYEKELSFQVSSSYGPGRYDPAYEEDGQDYPLGFVRWTSQRNFEAVLDMMASGALNMTPLVSHRFDVEQAADAYELLASGAEPYLGIILNYPGTVVLDKQSVRLGGPIAQGVISKSITSRVLAKGDAPIVSFIGAGNYAGRVLIPAFKSSGVILSTIANNGGVTGAHYGRKNGFKQVTTDIDTIFADTQTNMIVVATRHDSHAQLVMRALEAGKHVFCEKPLALKMGELEAIRRLREELPANEELLVMVGFNRRFAPLVERMHMLLKQSSMPKSFIMTVNAGAIPTEHWTQNPEVGGGRLIGEACHFIDLMRFLAGHPIRDWTVHTVRNGDLHSTSSDDQATISLTFEDGSIGTIHYFANGHKSFPKERLEVFTGGRILQLDNYRVLRAYGWPGFKNVSSWRQDKGQKACAHAFVNAVRDGKPSPIPFDELMEVSRITIEVGEAARA